MAPARTGTTQNVEVRRRLRRRHDDFNVFRCQSRPWSQWRAKPATAANSVESSRCECDVSPQSRPRIRARHRAECPGRPGRADGGLAVSATRQARSRTADPDVRADCRSNSALRLSARALAGLVPVQGSGGGAQPCGPPRPSETGSRQPLLGASCSEARREVDDPRRQLRAELSAVQRKPAQVQRSRVTRATAGGAWRGSSALAGAGGAPGRARPHSSA